jgi:hypothetical protein
MRWKRGRVMATERYFTCKCSAPDYCGELFEALHNLAKLPESICPRCGEAKQLHLIFQFGLGAGSPDCKVLAVFSPEEGVSWQTDEGETVTFYPFLVVLESDERQKIWLPYWHTVEKAGHVQKKYGQWAPFLDDDAFRSLYAQAQRRGYLREKVAA